MKKRAKNITLDDLAAMVAEGFAETATKDETATKQDITRLDKSVDGLGEDIKDVAERLGLVEAKLDRALYKEVARLESLIRQLADKMHVKLEY
jgi:hypothetical protein